MDKSLLAEFGFVLINLSNWNYQPKACKGDIEIGCKNNVTCKYLDIGVIMEPHYLYRNWGLWYSIFVQSGHKKKFLFGKTTKHSDV